MKYFVVKIKEQDLFFNADEVMGEYIGNTPILLSEEQCESIMRYSEEIYDIDYNIKYNKSQLEIRQVKLEVI